MKNRISLLTMVALLLTASIWLSSCSDDDESPKPAPQVTGDQSSLNLVPEASGTINLTIVAPGKFADVTATADKGTVSLSNITGKETVQGTATLSYTAPDETGNFKITVNVTDKSSKAGTLEITVAVTAKPPVTLAANSEVSGTWEKNTTYIAQGTLIVPAGKSLTIQEGVTVIFDGDGSKLAPEFAVSGSLYSMGTKEKPVLFTIPEAKRIKANIFAGLWGGIQATQSASEVVLQFTTVEYGGAPTGSASNPSTNIGPYADGDPRYGILFSNTNGKFVMQNSQVRYTADDGMRITGGTVLITNNMFILNGKTGGEAVNIKSSVTGNIAYNVAYRPATNGFKISNVSGSSATPQTDVVIYNNTIVESGWRQTKAGRGASINTEKGTRGTIYNNLIVNSRYGVKIVADSDTSNIKVGYTEYYGAAQAMVDEFYLSAGSWLQKTYKETSKDIAGGVGENDPKFSNYTVSSYTSTSLVDPATLDYLPASADFHRQAGAPGLTVGKTSFTLKPNMTVNGITYEAPAPSAFIGAFGTK
jgi:hypothetical protein